MTPERKGAALSQLRTISLAKARLQKAGPLGKVIGDLLDKALNTSSKKALLIAQAILVLPNDAALGASLKEEITRKHSPLYNALNVHRNILPITFYRTGLLGFFSRKTRSLLEAEKACHEMDPVNLTPEAAKFMLDNLLTIRNSYTKQLISLHYGRESFPETHSHGNGRYCVPLWTVAVPGLMNAQNDKIEGIIDQFTCSSGIPQIKSEEQQPSHLHLFLNKIKEFISPHVPLGIQFRHQFDYELIVARGHEGMYLDNMGRYPTGGRFSRVQDEHSIIYRITLNSIEIEYLKQILRGAYDQHILGLEYVSRDVALSARQSLAHQVSIEIIIRKLVHFLNAAGQLKTVITLSKPALEALIMQQVNKPDGEIQYILKNKRVCSNLEAGELLTAQKYTPKLT